MNGGAGEDFDLWKIIALVLSAEKLNPHLDAQSTILLRDLCSSLWLFCGFLHECQMAISSAKMEVYGAEGMSFIMMRKRVGEMTLPWGRPLRSRAGADWVPLTQAVNCLLEMNALMKLYMFPVILRSFIFWRRPACHTRSYALDMSRNTAVVDCLLDMDFEIESTISVIWSLVECAGRKADWFLLMSFSVSRYHCRRFLTIDSNILDMHEVRDIGL